MSKLQLHKAVGIMLLFAHALVASSWPTFGGDAQRSGWAKDETIISRDSVKQFRLLWKLKLDNEPKELNSLTPPIAVNPVYTDHGAMSLVVVGGGSDNLFVIDADTGKLLWQKHFTTNAPPPKGWQESGNYFCPNALNDTPAVVSTRDGPTVYIISIDGSLHALNLITGEDRFPPKPFVPPYSKNWSLNVVNQVVYTTISQNCGGAANGVWGFDLAKKDNPVVSFTSNKYGGGIWGRGGPSAGRDGVVYASTGDGTVDPANGKYSDSIVALKPKTLTVSNYYTPVNANYLTRKDLDMSTTTPIVFTYKNHDYLVNGGKEGRLVLLDATALGGDNHRTPLFQTPLLTNLEADIAGKGFWGAFASWEDASNTRWLYAPAWGSISPSAPQFPKANGPAPNGSIMAFQVQDKNGKPELIPAWISRDLNLPEPPVVANGVVLALSSGEFARQISPEGRIYTSQERIARTTGHAVLYAFDAKTGEELYSSGTAITSFTHLGGLAVSEGRVFVTTHDATVYAFGIPDQ